MRAVVFESYGDPDVLQPVYLPDPTPQVGEVRIRVMACAVNHLDLDIRSGTSRFHHPPQHILGREVAGFIDKVGPAVQDYRPGDRVLVSPIIPCGECAACLSESDNLCSRAIMPGINLRGGYAEYMVAPARGLFRISPEVSFETAAATLISFGTAWRMLVTLAKLQFGERVLINAAAGGLGTALVQVAILQGAHVIGSVGSLSKAAHVLAQGAATVVDYGTNDLASEVLRLTDGNGVDVAVDHIGGALLEQSLACAGLRARIITGGGHGGETVPVDIISFFRREIQLMGSRSQRQVELRTVLELVAQTKLQPVVSRVLPLAQAAEAHRLFESRSIVGKVILEP